MFSKRNVFSPFDPHTRPQTNYFFHTILSTVEGITDIEKYLSSLSRSISTPGFYSVDVFKDAGRRVLDLSENVTSTTRFNISMGIASIPYSNTIYVSIIRCRTCTDCQGIHHQSSEPIGISNRVVEMTFSDRSKAHHTPRTSFSAHLGIENDLRYRETVEGQVSIEIFVIFTCKKVLWMIKDKGESWTDQYFCDVILTQNLFPFFNNEENVTDSDEIIFVHDKAPSRRANKTQHLLQDNDVKFSVNDIWPENSPDINVAERIGSIIKDAVEKKC